MSLNAKPRTRSSRMRRIGCLGALIFAAQLSLAAQGLLYTFTGNDTHELDGSFIVLDDRGVGPVSIADLNAAVILDSFGPEAAFDILSPPNSITSFAISSFGPTGFEGELRCEMYGYLGAPSQVVLSGNPAAISFSSNLFFPGNPAGGLITGIWEVAIVPEPCGLSVLPLAAILIRNRLARRRATPCGFGNHRRRRV